MPCQIGHASGGCFKLRLRCPCSEYPGRLDCQPFGDQGDLRGGLALAVDDFREAGTEQAVVVQGRHAFEGLEGQCTKPVEGGIYGHRSAGYF